jgi:hypothetical protein
MNGILRYAQRRWGLTVNPALGVERQPVPRSPVFGCRRQSRVRVPGRHKTGRPGLVWECVAYVVDGHHLCGCVMPAVLLLVGGLGFACVRKLRVEVWNACCSWTGLVVMIPAGV